MGSQRRREAIAAGLPVENSEAARRRRRVEAAIVREEIAIRGWAAGKTSVQISEDLFRETGARLVGNVPELVRRGLYRRVSEGAADVDTARERFRELYARMLSKWLPLAAPEDDDITPDSKAADITLRIIRDWAVAEGVMAPPRSGDINLNVLNGVQVDDPEMRKQVLASLAAESAKQQMVRTIEGESFTAPEHDAEDGKVPPPVILPKRPD
jgi:hypothetical protein